MPRRRRRKAVAKKTYGKMVTRSAGISGAVLGLKTYLGELSLQRADLDAQIQAVTRALEAMGGHPVAARIPGRPGRPPGRPPGRRPGGKALRPGSLKAFIADVLSSGGIMAVKDITSGVLKAGYKTQNKTLAKSVGIALTEMRGVAKVGRGRFRLK
jgi:hypothetical protein